MRIYPPDQEELRKRERNMPKPLTKAEWEVIRDGKWEGDSKCGRDLTACLRRVDATVDALFAYRERTRGMWPIGKDGTNISFSENAEEIAAELGIE